MHAFKIDNQTIPVVKTKRKKSIGLKIKPKGIELHIPQHLVQKEIDLLLQHHQNWILKQLKKAQRIQAQKQQSVFKGEGGEPLLYLGQTSPLHLHFTDQKHPKVEWQQTGMFVHLPVNLQHSVQRFQTIQQALKKWYIQSAERHLNERCQYFAACLGLTYSAIQIKTYKARWGSCYPDGRIQFNWRLMQAPNWVVDYVVVHELCHLRHPNHSAHFWQMVVDAYPQTELAKTWLKQHGGGLIDFLEST